MFLHLIAPDPKFPKLIRKLFESASSENHTFIIIADGKKKEPSLEGDFITIQSPNQLSQILSTQKNWSGIFLHGLLLKAEPFVRIIPTEIKISWLIWGYEIYRVQFPKNRDLLDPETHRYAFGKNRCSKIDSTSPLFFFTRTQRKKRRRKSATEYLFQRITYIVTQFETEYNLLKEWGYLTASNQWHGTPVLKIDDLIGSKPCKLPTQGNDIQVGNSATVTNNHIDVFKKLASLELGNRRIITPLSYGDPAYRDHVIAQGNKILGDRFSPITGFMPLDEYLKQFENCSTTIINTHRQQGVGNILASIWQGRIIYLGESAVLTSYRKQGLPVYSFNEEFDLNRPPINQQQALEFRDKIQETVGENAIFNSISSLLKKMSTPL
jgi:dTDP-N-acetylfucosamine:lipid II N-acetylfucosaminyltransferase